jgi:hypothetical protein
VVSYVASVDLGGAIPQMFVDLVQKTQPLIVGKLRDTMVAKRKAKKQKLNAVARRVLCKYKQTCISKHMCACTSSNAARHPSHSVARTQVVLLTQL